MLYFSLLFVGVGTCVATYLQMMRANRKGNNTRITRSRRRVLRVFANVRVALAGLLHRLLVFARGCYQSSALLSRLLSKRIEQISRYGVSTRVFVVLTCL